MKKKNLLIYLASFLAGIISSLYISNILSQQLWDYSAVAFETLEDNSRYQNEFDVRFMIPTIQSIESGDTSALYKISCARLSRQVDKINPQYYSSDSWQREDTKKVKTEGTKLLNKLVNQGYCSHE